MVQLSALQSMISLVEAHLEFLRYQKCHSNSNGPKMHPDEGHTIQTVSTLMTLASSENRQ